MDSPEVILERLVYPALGLPLLALAIRCWARSAREASKGWLLLGLLLATLGGDGLVQVHIRLFESTHHHELLPWFWVAVVLALAVVVHRSWRGLEGGALPSEA